MCVCLCREGHQEATRLLLDSGAQINVPSGSNDDTPLTLACWKGHEEVVSLLIERNSNVNHQTKTGCTPLMEATRSVDVCACVKTGCTGQLGQWLCVHVCMCEDWVYAPHGGS